MFKANFLTTTFAGLLLVSSTNIFAIAQRQLRGEGNIKLPASYDEHLKLLKETSVSIPAAEMTTMTTAQLPEGVFDIEKSGDEIYMQEIFSRCLNSLNPKNPEEVLGCQLLFSNSWSTQPQALGTFKIGVDLLSNLAENGEYKKEDINIFFKDHALATMVKEGCFVFDTQINVGTSSLYSFVSQESYRREVTNGRGGSVGLEGKLGPVTANAGYSSLTTEKNGIDQTRKLAVGEKFWERNAGVLTNQCLTNEQFFKEVIVKHNLIKDEWVKRWEFVQKKKDANQLAQSSEFQEVAKGGLFMPSAYTYTSSVSMKTEMSYLASTVKTSHEISRGIEAGLKIDIHKIGQKLTNKGLKKAFGEGAGKFAFMITGENLKELESTINKKMKGSWDLSSQTESNSDAIENSELTVSLKQVGTGVSAECIFDPNMDCSTHLAERVNEMRSNLVTIGKPTSQRTFISLHDIVLWYTGSELGSQFDDALNQYFMYAECNAVGSEFDRGFQIQNGSGKVVESGVCARNQHMACGSALFMIPTSVIENNDKNLLQEVQGEVCQELTYSCDVPGNVFDRWIHGKNKIVDSFGNHHSCEQRQVCSVQGRNVHNKHDLCSNTWRCMSHYDLPQICSDPWDPNNGVRLPCDFLRQVRGMNHRGEWPEPVDCLVNPDDGPTDTRLRPKCCPSGMKCRKDAGPLDEKILADNHNDFCI